MCEICKCNLISQHLSFGEALLLDIIGIGLIFIAIFTIARVLLYIEKITS